MAVSLPSDSRQFGIKTKKILCYQCLLLDGQNRKQLQLAFKTLVTFSFCYSMQYKQLTEARKRMQTAKEKAQVCDLLE